VGGEGSGWEERGGSGSREGREKGTYQRKHHMEGQDDQLKLIPFLNVIFLIKFETFSEIREGQRLVLVVLLVLVHRQLRVGIFSEPVLGECKTLFAGFDPGQEILVSWGN
jgi:hypothetical protein